MVKRTRRTFGKICQLPSGYYQASHLGADGKRYNAPHTFDTKADADAWLSAQHTDIARDEWHKPTPVRETTPVVAAYAEAWLATRNLRPRTRSEYRKTFHSHLRGPSAVSTSMRSPRRWSGCGTPTSRR